MPSAPPRASTVPQSTFLRIQGPQAAEFLQGQITQDIRNAGATPLYTAFCAANGKVLYLAHIWEHHEAFYLYHPASCVRTHWMGHLKKYSRFSHLSIEDLSDAYQAYAAEFCEGPEGGTEATTSDAGCLESTPWVWHTAMHQEWLLPVGTLPTAHILDAATAHPFWEYARIRTGFPVCTQAVSGLFFAHHLHVHKRHGIHFQKGCYLGQEIIARMEFRGKSKRHLTAISSAVSLGEPGATLSFEGNPWGQLVHHTTFPDPETGQVRHWYLAVISETFLQGQLLYCPTTQTPIPDVQVHNWVV